MEKCTQNDFTFVVCAYKESPYLEECICSLKNQTASVNIVLVTSTPNEHIEGLVEKYRLSYYVNTGESGITQDWNFALDKVKTRYATIAHQDDIYESDYSKYIIEYFNQSVHPLIAFTDYSEIRNGIKVYDVPMLKIKRRMLAPFKVKKWSGSKFVRRRILSLGDPICCPSVSFCLDNLQRPIFNNRFRSCEDWEAWEKISKMNGDFVYVPKALMAHRIHEASATTEILRDNARVEENYIMYCKFWPKFIAGFINKYYTLSEKSNELE